MPAQWNVLIYLAAHYTLDICSEKIDNKGIGFHWV
jgi:hypothetical protein